MISRWLSKLLIDLDYIDVFDFKSINFSDSIYELESKSPIKSYRKIINFHKIFDELCWFHTAQCKDSFMCFTNNEHANDLGIQNTSLEARKTRNGKHTVYDFLDLQ